MTQKSVSTIFTPVRTIPPSVLSDTALGLPQPPHLRLNDGID